MEVSQAAVQIGHVAEVVAALVEHLDTLELVKAQRVSRTWAYEIRRSQICQEKLFALPGARHEILIRSKTEDGRDFYYLRDWKEEDGVPHASAFDAIVVDAHPLIKPTKSKLYPALFEDFDFERVRTLSTETWQEMFITQPPTPRADLEVGYIFDDGPFLNRPETVWHYAYVREDEGVRFRHILPELEQMVYPKSAEFWTWLPDAYESAGHAYQSNIPLAAISLDDYIASYGFPRAVETRIEVPNHVDATDMAVVAAVRAQTQGHDKVADTSASLNGL